MKTAYYRNKKDNSVVFVKYETTSPFENDEDMIKLEEDSEDSISLHRDLIKKSLEEYYKSDENWTFQIKYKTSVLTEHKDWFANVLPAIDGDVGLRDDKKKKIKATISQQKAMALNKEIQVIRALEIVDMKNEILEEIENIKTTKALEEYDFKKKLKSINRVLTL
jgi:hypothetical protein